MWRDEYGKAKTLYSILNSHSPKNPQSLTNFAIGIGDTYFQTIMAQFKSTEHKKYWDDFEKAFKEKNKGKNYWNNRRKQYKIWRKDVLSKMIVKDPKPHKLKDISNKTIIKSKDNKV